MRDIQMLPLCGVSVVEAKVEFDVMLSSCRNCEMLLIAMAAVVAAGADVVIASSVGEGSTV